MAETIYMIHGMWGGSWYWENYRQFFEGKGYQCKAITLPYHDADPKFPPDPRLGKTGLLDYVAYLENEIDALDVKPILMGHSMGGLLAQILASRGRAKALILLTPASPAGIMAITPSSFRSFLSIQSRWGFWRKPGRQTFAEAVYSMLHLLTPAQQRETYDQFVYESGRAGCEIGYWFLYPNRPSQVEAAKVTCRTLIIAGRQDRIVPVSVTRQIRDKYQAVADYKEFDNHAHWVVAEPGWEEIAEYVFNWRESVKR
jgi:pimeloyl-ACP methyl ester carboxylesterase